MNSIKASPTHGIVIQRALSGQWFTNLSEDEQRALRNLESATNSAQLSDEQILAFSAYAGGSFQYFNSYLRKTYGIRGKKALSSTLTSMARYNPKTLPGTQNRENDEKNINSLKAAYANAPLIQNQITVYRGCGRYLLAEDGENLLESNPRKEDLISKTFVEPGFLSTSANKGHAQGFKRGVFLTLSIPANTKAFYVTERLEGRPFSPGKKLRDEDEIIFEPGRKMRITDVRIYIESHVLNYEIKADMLSQ